ncbi:MAG TPA: hypothetical protein VN715_20455 [Roseiarcus sp.]|nr:hypothetical protein [Roseiarcus sp.]
MADFGEISDRDQRFGFGIASRPRHEAMIVADLQGRNDGACN